MSFFPKSSFISSPPVLNIPRCGACGLYKHCKSPKMPPTGKGRRKILLVGEAPGKTEDEDNEQFVGKAGKYFKNAWSEVDIDMDVDCHKTNALICRPHTDNDTNRSPKPEELDHCLPNLQSTIKSFNPEIIVAAGLPALKSVLHGQWIGGIKKIDPWVGWTIPSQKYNVWICPVWHPSYVMREEENPRGGTAVPLLFQQHLRAISKLSGRPWDSVPNYRNQVEPILSSKEAAKIIRKYRRLGWPGAFDYETNMLKPDSAEAEIYTAGICWKGKRTIAFPFHGPAVDEFKKWLLSPCRKIAQNMKFEDRWSRAKLGIEVQGWFWDTMINAHIYDNRTGCTGLAFLALVWLGFPAWDQNIHPFLESEYANEKNHIQDIELRDLLVYNGIDCLVEYKVFELQYAAMIKRVKK